MSGADNLVSNDQNGNTDIFLRDRQTGVTTLVSARAGVGSSGNGASFAPVVSWSHRYVVFESDASNLVLNDTNGVTDLFLRDLDAGQTYLVSVSSTGVPANGVSHSAEITPDGRFVVFESYASNLASGDDNNATDIYVRDLVQETTRLVSTKQFGIGSGNKRSEQPTISDDGRFVVYQSLATDIVIGGPNGQDPFIFLRDLQLETNFLVSLDSSGLNALSGQNPVMSADGRFVFFEGKPPTQSPGSIVRQDLVQHTNVSVTGNFVPPITRRFITPDGRYAVFTPDGISVPRPSGVDPLFLWDATMQTTNLISAKPDGLMAAGAVFDVSITSDARYISFLSTGTNLIGTPTPELLQLYRRDLQLSQSVQISVNGYGVASTRESLAPSMSADGQTFAFQTTGANLAAGDFNDASDVFVRDFGANTTELISSREASLPSATPRGLNSLNPGSIGNNSRFLAFVSTSPHLTTNDANRAGDVFLHDRQSGQNTLISVDTNGTSTGTSHSSRPIISGDSRYVAFLSMATNLSGLRASGRDQVYLRDVIGGTTTLVSRKLDASAAGNNTSANLSMSDDGRWLAYQSTSSDIASSDANLSASDVFVFDRVNQTNILVSVNAAATGTASTASDLPVISRDGKFVLFRTSASDIAGGFQTSHPPKSFLRSIPNQTTVAIGPLIAPFFSTASVSNHVLAANGTNAAIFSVQSVGSVKVPLITWHDLSQGIERLICTNCTSPTLSGNGRLLAFIQTNQSSGVRDVYVYDANSSNRWLISVSFDGALGGDGDSSSPEMSPDGRYIAFRSRASNLVRQGDTNGQNDIFVRDLLTSSTQLISPSHGSGNLTANGLSTQPIFARDSRALFFENFADNLTINDFNQNRDIFAVEMSAGDVDGDGLDDDWEVAYFGDLSRDGTGDSDGDGFTDKQEFRAGTNPVSNTSLLRVKSISSAISGQMTLIWSATPGRSYRIQFKDDLNQADWSELPGEIIASGPTASAVDSTFSTSNFRFYRAIVLSDP